VRPVDAWWAHPAFASVSGQKKLNKIEHGASFRGAAPPFETIVVIEEKMQ
jgi:hypothetical protein